MNKKQQLKGAGFVLLSSVFFAGYGIWSKLMMGVFGEFNQAWVRAIILLAILIPLGLVKKVFKPIKKNDRIWFISIALAGGFNQAPYYFGFAHLPVGTATLLFYTFLTVGAYVLGKFFFREKLTLVKYLSLFLAVVGIYLIYSFSLTPVQILPAICTGLAGFMGAVGVVFSKKISGSYSEIQILSVYALVMLPGNLLLAGLVGESVPVFALSIPWLAALAYAVSLLIANFTVINGFKYLEPSIGGLIGLMEVVLAAIFGIVLFGEVLDANTVLGGLLILFAMALSEINSYFSSMSRRKK